MKITDEEISKAIPPSSCSCWIEGAKWCRRKMEEVDTVSPLGETAYDSRVLDNMYRVFGSDVTYVRSWMDGKAVSLKCYIPYADFCSLYTNNEYGQLCGKQWSVSSVDSTHDEKVQDGNMDAHWTTKGRFGDIYGTKDEEPFRQKQEGEKSRGWMDKSELMFDMAKYRETHPLEFGSADPDLQLRLLAVQKTNSLEEAEKVLRWLKGETNG